MTMSMELNTIDLVFWGFIILVVFGGIACLLIFLPREHDYEDKYNNCYRIRYRDGVYSVTRKKAIYGENSVSLRSKYFYIMRAPFECEAFCDEAAAADGKKYKAAVAVTLCFPENKLQVFAPTFQNVSHEMVVETLSEAISAALEDAMKQYAPETGEEKFTEILKETVKEKLDIFGAYPMHINGLRISENK